MSEAEIHEPNAETERPWPERPDCIIGMSHECLSHTSSSLSSPSLPGRADVMEQDPVNALQADSFLRFNATAIFEAGGKLAQRLGDLPSRALARLRKLDELGQDLHEVAQVSQQAERVDVGRGQGYRRQRNVGNGTTPPIPGPWGFLTSGYFVGLFIMVGTPFRTITLHRPRTLSPAKPGEVD